MTEILYSYLNIQYIIIVEIQRLYH